MWYEGRSHSYASAIWPRPFLSQGCINLPGEKVKLADPLSLQQFDLIFREDSFDPVTRIRRGRFYKRTGSLQWHTAPHPILSEGSPERVARSLESFSSFRFDQQEIEPSDFRKKVVALGAKDAHTFWGIVFIETISTGEQLFTLKARTMMGVLPELILDAMPSAEQNTISEKIEKLADVVHRSGNEGIIDLCREATVAALGAKVREKQPDERGNDLGNVTKIFESQYGSAFSNVANSARIIARLHSRTKTAEQESRSIRPIVSQDAEHAVYCLSSILCDLGWAKWV